MTGRLGRDPEYKTTPRGTAVCEFSIAVDSGFGDKKITNWPNCVVWGALADFVGSNVVKGDEVTVKGELTTGSYENSDGKKVYWTKVSVGELRVSKPFRSDDDEDERSAPPARTKKPEGKKKAAAYNPMDDDEDD